MSALPRKRAAGTFRSRLRWRTINYRLSLISQRHGRGAGVGRGLGVGAGLGVGVALGVDVAVGVGDADAVAVAVGVAVAVAVGVGEGDAQGLTGQLKISVEARDPRFSSMPPASQMLLVPSVSLAELRRAVTNGVPSDHVSLTG